MADEPKIDLSIYLAKDDIALPNGNIKNVGALNKSTLDLRQGCRATLYVRRQTSNTPKWAALFHNFVDASAFGRNSSTGAVLSIPWQQRTFLISFGQGWHNIDSAKIEKEFGLKTALNILDPESIRSIDKSTLEAQPTQQREQSGRATEVQYFGIDVERDLLRAVTGKPADEYFGNRVSGLDSIHLSLDIDPEELPDLLDMLLAAYRSDAYKNGPFSWIDHIGQIRDPEVTKDLDNTLIENLNHRDIEKVWLSVPEIIDWNRVVGFRYSMARRAPRVYDVRVLDFLETFEDGEVTPEDLMRRKIYCVDADDKPVLDRPAYYYLYAEVERNNEVCLLNNGKWYRIETNYADTINQNFNSIVRYDKEMPCYNDESEGAYNSRVANNEPAEYVLMDTDLAYVRGAASGVEICDLYRNDKEFIHVKRYGGSSVLSHLFNQGLVSGELFRMDSVYRNIVNDKLPADRKIDPARSPLPKEYRVVYAVVSESDEPLSVPFFSKISLKNCVSRLEAMGFTAMLTKISVEQQRKILKTYAPAPDKI
ncbi:TIGR04141 family sporadically distributed protein [Methylophaga sp. OBS4]|uniref:TIGR04141 family sporadically distributed protein n=1 Tax=Methylophaga sp. OBS4 TaxID=2991935 RepID=UPI00225AF9C9|nr:TIGR04141 family sporadically distributed protein [Methylophaga sp. OBS4]MCX4188149.1 TIGR04141 family sporadically distributed protein [Methylophaga sp. OBS4]